MFSSIVEPPMLNALRNCNVMLHLTGSRFFGGYTEKSDYDFFCEATQKNFEIISSLGKWTTEEMTLNSVTYNDSNTSEVWIHYATPSIHIQFVRDIDLKIQTQNFLINFPFSRIEKPTRKAIWNWALKNVLNH